MAARFELSADMERKLLELLAVTKTWVKSQKVYIFLYLSLIGIILRWGFLFWELIFIYCGLFVLILVVFVLFLLSQRFGQISPLDRQQLWKAVITGDTVTSLSIPIRGRGKITWRRPEVKFGRNVVKEETTQKIPRWGQKVLNE